MDPVSQTQASESLAARGFQVIGWYHSHPAFDPNPSIRDIDTQAKYQVQQNPQSLPAATGEFIAAPAYRTSAQCEWM